MWLRTEGETVLRHHGGAPAGRPGGTALRADRHVRPARPGHRTVGDPDRPQYRAPATPAAVPRPATDQRGVSTAFPANPRWVATRGRAGAAADLGPYSHRRVRDPADPPRRERHRPPTAAGD